VLAAFALLVLPASAQTGLRPQAATHAPQNLCVRDVLLAPGDDGERATLLLSGGRIEARLAADAPTPKGYAVIEGEGRLLLPAFVDAFTTRGVSAPPASQDRTGDGPHVQDARADVLADMRPALRRGLRPSFRAVDVAELSTEHLDAWRAAGFGYALQSPAGELLSGRGALVSLRDGALRDRVVVAEAAMHASFSSSGGGYPSTLMGRFAHLRQFALDAGHWAELEQRRTEGRPGPRPPYDPDLVVGAELARGELSVLCAADRAADVRRWLRFAQELGWRVVILGGAESGELAPRLAGGSVPVVLTLEWGDEPDDPRKVKPKGKRSASAKSDDSAGDEDPGESEESEDAEESEDSEDAEDAEDSDAATPEGEEGAQAAQTSAAPAEDSAEARLAPYAEPYAVRLDRRLEWEQRRDSALVLARADAPFAFGSAAESPGELLGRVRKLVEAGLPRDAALAALTRGAAGILAGNAPGDVPRGSLAAGAPASFALWSADPLTDKKARVVWMFVEGHGWQAPPAKDAVKKDGESKGDAR